MTVTHELKTVALQQVMAEHKWDALITGIRRDEDPTRAKERYFQPADEGFRVGLQGSAARSSGTNSPPPARPASMCACRPCWTGRERDIWLYIQREGIPIPKMYFARTADGRQKYRFRSLGCWPITHAVESEADTIDAIIDELAITKTSERAGRAQDHHERNAMQKLRAKGFM